MPIKILNPEFVRVSISQELIALKNFCEGFLLFFALYNILESKKLCTDAIWGLIILFVFCNFTVILGWYDIISIPGLRTNHLGETSAFGNQNDYAAFMLLCFPFMISFMTTVRNKIYLLLHLIFLIISLISFLFTGSRGGFIAFLFLVFFT